MYKNILVPVAPDHGKTTTEALRIADVLREEGGKITALTVMEPIPSYIMANLPEDQWEKNRASTMQMLEDEAGSIADCAVVTGHPGRTITDYADEHGIDCIVIASHQPGMQDIFLGSTAARVVRHAHCAVHVVR